MALEWTLAHASVEICNEIRSCLFHLWPYPGWSILDGHQLRPDQHMNSFDLEATIAALPHGLDRALLRVLRFHQGRSSAISRFDLLRRLKDIGFDVNERAMRAQINVLRKDGHLIGAAAGEGGGYYLIISREEFEEFIQTEFRSKIIDMSETVRALERQADAVFGQAYQPSLF